MGANLYVHFPFCRTKCSYCVLHSRAGSSETRRAAYVQELADEVRHRMAGCAEAPRPLSTIYFGGGSPALCDLRPLLSALGTSHLAPGTEFTVELHPLDVTRPLLETLRAGGVNRISMGVQSFDNEVLKAMRRGYTIDEAHRAFDLVRAYFDNAGIDLIVGYPGDDRPQVADWGFRHVSLYSLILEPGSMLAHQHPVLDEERTMDQLQEMGASLKSFGLERYEISSYAVPGYECRHNLAVWSGEDYIGLGEGAYGREGLIRTSGQPSGRGAAVPPARISYTRTTVTPDEDRRERTLFRLRTRLGLDTAAYPAWRERLDFNVAQGLLVRRGDVYYLTPRGAEVCDAILADL